MKNDRNCFLRVFLDCGEDDLAILDEIGFHYADVLKRMGWPDVPAGGITLNNILRTIYEMALENLKEAIRARIEELRTGGGVDDELRTSGEIDEELKALENLDPDNDIETDFNYYVTRFTFIQNAETYQLYLGHALDEFYRQTGFDITE